MTPSLFVHLANLHRPRREGHSADGDDLPTIPGLPTAEAGQTDNHTDPDLHQLAQVASDLADAIVAGRVPLSVGALNALARAALSSPQLIAEPTTAAVRLERSESRADPTGVLAARVATELVAADLSRLKECARSECRLVFYDDTRSRTGRWHAEAPCGRLERQRRHRTHADR